MISPAAFDESVTPFMVLAGQKWPVPALVPRQLRHIRSDLMDFNDRLNAVVGGTPGEIVGAFVRVNGEEYERLLLRPIFWALTRAHPALTWDEFLDWDMDEADIVDAWFVVRKQSRLFAPTSRENEHAAPALGEDEAAVPSK